MTLYSYTALDADNVISEGVLDEIDKQAAARRLIHQGLRPIEIKPQAAAGRKTFSLERFRQKKLTRGDIDFFTEQIALLLNSGLSLDGALRVMRQYNRKQAFQDFAGQLEQKLKEGKSFSQALSDYPHFSPMYISIVRAGEEGGILPAMLQKISEYQSTFQELKQFIISASIYPLFLLSVGVIAVIILLTAILPRFEILFQGMGQELPMNVKIMMDFARFMKEHFIIAMALIAAPPAALIWYLKSEDGRQRYHRLTIRMPIISGFIRSLETTRIFRTLEVLVNNGVHLSTALKISSGVAANIEYKRLLNRATQALKEGQQIGQKLKSEGLLPDLAADLLSIGEESGRVGLVCSQIADHYEKEVRTRVKRIISLVEPLFILVIAVVAGYIVISMLSVILGISDITG